MRGIAEYFGRNENKLIPIGIGAIALSIAVVFGAIFVMLGAMSSPVEAQAGVSRVQSRGHLRSWTALSAVGATASQTINAGARVHTTQLVVTGGPAACTGRLQGSNDGGTTWFDITSADITCTSSIASTTVDVVALAVRFNLLTLSGGTSPTVTAHYAGL